MRIFNIFGKKDKKKIQIKFGQEFPGESKEMKYHRIEISKEFQNLLNRIDDIRADDKMNAEQKYGIMLGSLYMINKISGEMIEGNKFFSDKQFEKIHNKVKNELKDKVPNYIG